MGTLIPLYEIRFHCTASGREPAREWLRDLSAEARRAIGEDIRTVQFGWPLGMPLVRKMEAGLWEIRSDVPEGIARILFTFTHRSLVLLHGFIKKSDRTPLDDLEIARRRRQEVHAHAS